MATEIGNNETEVLTQAMAGPEETLPRPESSGQDGETPPIRDHQVAEGPAPRRVHTRNRKARAFTMSDEVHALLGTIAERNGATMSAYIETLILTADDLSIDTQAQDLLGVLANKAGKTRGQIVEMLVRQAETVLSWDPDINDRIGAMAAVNGMTRAAFLELLVLKAEGILSWAPPRMKPRAWWRFWQQPQWEEAPSSMLKPIVEASPTPSLTSPDLA